MGRPRKADPQDSYEGRLAASIRRRREKAGLTHKQLAEATGVGESSVYAWENGRRSPTINTLPKIAAALGVTVRTLMPPE